MTSWSLVPFTSTSNPEPQPTDSDTRQPLYLDSVWRPVSLWAAWEPLRGQNILSDGDWAHRTQNMTLPTPSQLSCEDSQKFILTALCSHILRSDWNKNNNEWASCNCFDNKGRVVCLFSIFKIKHFSRNLDLRLKAWCFSKQHEDRTQEND